MTLDLGENIEMGYYMPHHAVVREQKESTKVRIVFDASSKGKDKLSLNDCLETGPNLNPDLLKIILRFRLHPIAFCADIQRAFLEVGIAREDREFLKFLWVNREGPNLHPPNLQAFQYTRVPFGVKCSPFLLTATLRLHIEKYETTYSESCEMLKELYVDDLISGTDDVRHALKLSKEMILILSEASMNLRRWVSNSPELCELWKKTDIDSREILDETGVPLKVLGLIWDNVNDNLKFDVSQFGKLKDNSPTTKRNILAACGMLFDPIGIMNPFTIKIKLVLQVLWERGIQWDESVPSEIETAFQEWLSDVERLKVFEIPRVYFSDNCWNSIEVHIFSDASPRCYGSVAYFRIRKLDECMTRFIISKSRLAPLKKMTLPRLELMGTLVSARLGSYLQSTFPMLDPKNIFYWTDSQICIHWIKGIAENWKQFVRNRVVEIKERTNPHQWYFCSGKINPADKLTRGIRTSELINDDAWISGPPWLAELYIPRSDKEPKVCPDFGCVEDEKRKVFAFHIDSEVVEPLLDLHKYSDLRKVLRISAYVLRFVNNSRPHSNKRYGALTAKELSTAENYWLRVVQKNDFGEEYGQLKAKTPIGAGSKLYGLEPIFAADGLIALKGRLQNSDLDVQSKHPIVLPNKSKFTELLIMNDHENVLHSGVSDTLSQIRERFWIIRGRQAVKSCLNKCLRCRRFKAVQGRQVVAPLPAHRINEAQAFEVTAIDFAGPLYTKDNDKSYIALFTCAVTRAVHLEIVSSLSSEHFLLAFRRFVSRRGVCRIINSDNALTFKGADTEVKRLYMNLTNLEIQNYFGKKGITWQYIVERAAWWGGYWERMVRMTKVVLRKILGRALVTFEELQTILAEIESILNSRPLTYVYNEPTEPSPLTPAHFFTGRRLTALPPNAGQSVMGDTSSTRKCLLKRYLYRERLLNQFWKRWRNEYLLQLKNVHVIKPINVTSKFNVGDIVLLGDDKAPRQMWKLGRVTETHLGRDRKVRSVTLKTATGCIKRPVQLLYHLELGTDST